MVKFPPRNYKAASPSMGINMNRRNGITLHAVLFSIRLGLFLIDKKTDNHKDAILLRHYNPDGLGFIGSNNCCFGQVMLFIENLFLGTSTSSTSTIRVSPSSSSSWMSLGIWFLIVEVVLRGVFTTIPFFFVTTNIMKRIVLKSCKFNHYCNNVFSQIVNHDKKNTGYIFNNSAMYCGLFYAIASMVLVELWIQWFSTLCIHQELMSILGTTNANNLWNSNGIFLVLVLLLVRIIFATIGTYLGQSLITIAITGSIATGKTTVVTMLQNKQGCANMINQHNTLNGTGTFIVIDSDTIGHDILLPPAAIELKQQAKNGTATTLSFHSVSSKDSVYDLIIETFGDPTIHNQNIVQEPKQVQQSTTPAIIVPPIIDRRKLGEIIFKDPYQRKKLNQITHPRIIKVLFREMIVNCFKHRSSRHVVVCADVPLLFESSNVLFRLWYGLIVVVACTDPTVQNERLRKRNPDLSEQQCYDRISSQMSMDKKIAMADIVIDNTINYKSSTGTNDETRPEPSSLQQQVDAVKLDLVGRLYGLDVSMAESFLFMGLGCTIHTLYTIVYLNNTL